PAAEIPGMSAVSVDAITHTNNGRLPRSRAANDLPRSGWTGNRTDESRSLGEAPASRLDSKRGSDKPPEGRQHDGYGDLDDLRNSAVHVAVEAAYSSASIPRASGCHRPGDQQCSCPG